MRPMTPKWRNAGLIFAALGFAAVALTGNLVGGAINAGLWFGLVYLAFLIVSAIWR